MRPEGFGNLIKIIHLIGSRTRDLQVYSIEMLEDGACRLQAESLSSHHIEPTHTQ
jgi:hypothetical protein